MKAIRHFAGKALVFAWGIVLCSLVSAAAMAADTALTGMVNSEKEPKMEGVLVSAKRVGGNITVTVVSDSQGRYSFPDGRLSPGKYRLSIRATGYDLEDPGAIDIASSQTKQVNLKLVPTRDLASQLTNAEWLMSAPGTMEQKSSAGCVGCHSLSVVFKSKYDAAALAAIIGRMRTYAEASIYQPAVALRLPVVLPYETPALRPENAKLAEYLSSINLSGSADGKWKFELKTLPRLKGRSTKVIVTEYDLPRRAFQPHDAAVDSEGMVWSPDLGGPYLARLNPRTGEVKEWHVPILKPDYPKGGLDIQFDKDGNPWITMMDQGGIAKFNKKTEKFTTWSVPSTPGNENAHVGMVAINSDGRVWFKDSRNQRVHRLDPKSNHMDTFILPFSFYGMRLDSRDNLYMASLQRGAVGEIDGETGKISVFPTPTPNSGSRRGDMDSQDRFWFGEYRAGKIGMFDTKTSQFKEWNVDPMPWSSPYDVGVDKNGDAWSGGELTDYVFRLDPKTGSVTTYLMPTLEMNVQRVSIDRSSSSVAIWVGQNHQAKLARIEPLD